MSAGLAALLIIAGVSLLGLLLYFGIRSETDDGVVIENRGKGSRIVRRWILKKSLWGYVAKRQHAYIVQQKTQEGWRDDFFVNRVKNTHTGEVVDISLISPNHDELGKYLPVPRIKSNGYSDVKYMDPDKARLIELSYQEWLLPQAENTYILDIETEGRIGIGVQSVSRPLRVTHNIEVGGIMTDEIRRNVEDIIDQYQQPVWTAQQVPANLDFASLYPHTMESFNTGDLDPPGLGGAIGISSRGPVNEPHYIESQEELNAIFGDPATSHESFTEYTDGLVEELRLERDNALNRMSALDSSVQALSDSIDREILSEVLRLNNTEENNDQVDG